MGAALLFCGPREAVGKNQPTLSIGVQNLNRFAGEAGNDVARQHARIRNAVFTDRNNRRYIDSRTVCRQCTHGSRRSARHIALDPGHGRSGFQAVPARIDRHALSDKPEPPAASRRAGIAQDGHHRCMGTAVADGQKRTQSQPLQRLSIIEFRFDWKSLRHVFQPLCKHIRPEQIRRAVYQIARLHD